MSLKYDENKVFLNLKDAGNVVNLASQDVGSGDSAIVDAGDYTNAILVAAIASYNSASGSVQFNNWLLTGPNNSTSGPWATIGTLGTVSTTATAQHLAVSGLDRYLRVHWKVAGTGAPVYNATVHLTLK